MPVKVSCPKCSKELNAPDSLIGKVAACPRCSTQFPVQPSAQGPSEVSGYYPPGFQSVNSNPPAGPPAAPIASMSPPLPATPATNRVAEVPVAKPIANTSSAPPVPMAPPPVANPPRTARPIQQPVQQPATASPPVPPTPVAPETKTARPKNNQHPPPIPGRSTMASPSQRTAKAAKFVTGGATTTRINLGEDGQLPELVVEDKEKPKEQTETQQTSKPLVLAVALCLSVAFSVAMLFLESESKPAASRGKAAARREVAKYYLGGNQDPMSEETKPLFEYQRLLRKALSAESRGDEQLAKFLYRRVLDMIHSEEKTDSIGLTGPRIAVSPPSDTHLKKQLSILLSDGR